LVLLHLGSGAVQRSYLFIYGGGLAVKRVCLQIVVRG
jgi:hypothetical protein